MAGQASLGRLGRVAKSDRLLSVVANEDAAAGVSSRRTNAPELFWPKDVVASADQRAAAIEDRREAWSQIDALPFRR